MEMDFNKIAELQRKAAAFDKAIEWIMKNYDVVPRIESGFVNDEHAADILNHLRHLRDRKECDCDE